MKISPITFLQQILYERIDIGLLDSIVLSKPCRDVRQPVPDIGYFSLTQIVHDRRERFHKVIVVFAKCAERCEQVGLAIAFCDGRECCEKVKVLGTNIDCEPCP